MSEEKSEAKWIGARLAVALHESGMSHLELETKAELGAGHVSRLIAGDRGNVPPEMLVRIADALEVTLDWLVAGRGPMRKPLVH